MEATWQVLLTSGYTGHFSACMSPSFHISFLTLHMLFLKALSEHWAPDTFVLDVWTLVALRL